MSAVVYCNLCHCFGGSLNDWEQHVCGRRHLNNMEFPVIPTLKCVLIGNRRTGKTTFIMRHREAEKRRFVDTLRVFVHPLVFETSRGLIRFNVWDVNNDEIPNGFWTQAQCAIIMFDVTNKDTYDCVHKWQQRLNQLNDNMPIVLCGNKVEEKEREVTKEKVISEYRLQYSEICAKTAFNVLNPFIHLATQVIGDQNLVVKPIAELQLQ